MAAELDRKKADGSYLKDSEEDEDLEIEDDRWDDWEEEGANAGLLCLFCDSAYDTCRSLFEHCAAVHFFDFYGIKKACDLDFYNCMKLVNYVRSQVAVNKCWSCGIACVSNKALQEHLHDPIQFESNSFAWDDAKYLSPFLADDALLYSFNDDEEDDENDPMSVDGKEIQSYLSELENIEICEDIRDVSCTSEPNGVLPCDRDEKFPQGLQSVPEQNGDIENAKGTIISARTSANEIRIANRNYFGSYSSFSIHREMISDKVRTDAYRQAVSENPSLIRGAVVMDVGCGTGILSLFAAQAGASMVIAVEASKKMAAVATRIARDNTLLMNQTPNDGSSQRGVIKVVESMVEELENSCIKPKSVDVIVSEWMGYCLLYESMLASVLFARDKWLKPGGAILPDTATMFVAGFGKGATSIPFWENVYGFDMSCIGHEVVEAASQLPVIDVVDKCNIVTTTEALQAFDLIAMQPSQMDFTAEVELIPNETSSSHHEPEIIWCYGVVIWFETGFTERFCREKPVTLSTSPYETSTHWAQTLLTLEEPVAMTPSTNGSHSQTQSMDSSELGTQDSPAARIHSRISVVRASQHRSIDISLEITSVGVDGRKRQYPPQMFCLS